MVAQIEALRKAEAERTDLEQMIRDPGADKEMVDLAYAERASSLGAD